MNGKQKAIVLAGIAFLLATLVYPPWVFVGHNANVLVERRAGYHVIFFPPEYDETKIDWWGKALVDTRIDFELLAIEWTAITLVLVGLLLAFRAKDAKAW